MNLPRSENHLAYSGDFDERLREPEGFYLSDDKKLIRTQKVTGLSFDEIIEIVGKFPADHFRGSMPKGRCVVKADGTVQLHHHYTTKVLWTKGD